MVVEAANGDELIEQLGKTSSQPDLAIIDVNMPKKDGFETVTELGNRYPQLPVLIISMIDKEAAVVKMLKLGVKGYLSKDVEPQDLRAAITAILKRGYYYTDFITGRLVHQLQKSGLGNAGDGILSEREIDFIRMASTELTYKQIAQEMGLSFKVVDSIRDNLFKKLQVSSRVGIVIYAFKNGLIDI